MESMVEARSATLLGHWVAVVSWSMARGSSWVVLVVSEGRGEPVPGWFIGWTARTN